MIQDGKLGQKKKKSDQTEISIKVQKYIYTSMYSINILWKNEKETYC